MLAISRQYVCHQGFKPFLRSNHSKVKEVFSKIEYTRNLLDSSHNKITDLSFNSLFSNIKRIKILNNNKGSLIQHDHFSNLNIDIELLVKGGCKVEADLLFELFKAPENKCFYFCFPKLVRYMDQEEIEKKDANGWTLLHWAIFLKHPPLVQELKKRNLNRHAEDNQGITPADLAVFTLSYQTLEKLYMHENFENKLSKISPSFHGKLIGKLKRLSVFNKGPFYGLLEGAIPDPDLLKDRNQAEITFSALYKPLILEKNNENITPMGLAVRQKNLGKIGDLLEQGWCNLIESYLVRKRLYEDNKATKDWHSELDRMEETDDNWYFFIDLIGYLMNKTRVKIDETTTANVTDKLKHWGWVERCAYRDSE